MANLEGGTPFGIPNDSPPPYELSETMSREPPGIITINGSKYDTAALGIDIEFLDALPEAWRNEIVLQHVAAASERSLHHETSRDETERIGTSSGKTRKESKYSTHEELAHQNDFVIPGRYESPLQHSLPGVNWPTKVAMCDLLT
jgi:hypothetical protein